MTMQRSLLLAAAAVLIQVLLVPAAAASRLSNPFSMPAHRQLLSQPLSGAACAVPTGQAGCGFGSLELWSANPGLGVVPTADLYWKQVPQSAGGYKLQFTIIPRTGNCLTKVVGIVGTTDDTTKLFYLSNDVVSPIVNAAAGTCWSWTTNALNYAGSILISAHADVGPCPDEATSCSGTICQTTCMRTGSDSCNVPAFNNNCNACCPGNGRNCQGSTITTSSATMCTPLPPSPSCPTVMDEGDLKTCVQDAVNLLTQTCRAQDATSLEEALASAAAGCSIPDGVTYKASSGISCTPDSSETVTFTATVDDTTTTCYDPVEGIFPGPTLPTCSAVPLACDAPLSPFTGTCTPGAANVNVTSFIPAACLTAVDGPPALALTYSPGATITCPTANQPATTVLVTVADDTSTCGTFSVTVSPTCPSNEPVIADADAAGVTVCSSDAEAVATFNVSNPGGLWAPAVTDFVATCPSTTALKAPGGVVLAGSTVTVTCVKGTGSWPATDSITLDAASITGPGGCTANPAAASQDFTANPAPAVDFDIAAAANICTEGNTVTTVSLTSYSVTSAASANLLVTVGSKTCSITSPPAWATAGPTVTFTCALTGPLTAGSTTLTAQATAPGTGACNDETATKSDSISLNIMQKPTVTVSSKTITTRECAGEEGSVTVDFDYTSTGATDKITVTPFFGGSACGLPVDITTSLSSGSSSVSCTVAAEDMAPGATITLHAVAHGTAGCLNVNSTQFTDTATIPVDSKPAANITSTTIPPTCTGDSGSIDVDFDYTSSNTESLTVTAKLGGATCGSATISSPQATGTGTLACEYESAADPTTVTLEIVATGSGGCATFTALNSDSDALTVVPLPTVDVTAQAVVEPQCAGKGANVSVPFTWTAGGSAAIVTVVAKYGTSQCGTKTLTVGTDLSPNSVSCDIPNGAMLTSLSDILIVATAASAATSACAGKTASDNGLSRLTVSAVPSVTLTITPKDTRFCAGKDSFDVTLGWSQTDTANLTLTPGATAGGVAANCGGARTIGNPAASGSITVTCTFDSGVTSAVNFSLSATGTNGAKPCTNTVTAAPASITSITAEGQICGSSGCGSMCLSGSCAAAGCNTAYGFPGVGAVPQFACTAAPPSASGACPSTQAGTPGSSCCSWGDLKYSNWGWTNYIAKGSDEVCEDVYAGAAQNTISKGRNVGRVCYRYLSTGRLNFTYSLKPNVLYNDVQVYAGANKPPSAPGQFTSKTSGLRNSNVAQPTGNFAVPGAPNNVWVAFHITVGDFPSAGAASVKTSQSGAGLKKPTKKKTKKNGGNRRSLL